MKFGDKTSRILMVIMLCCFFVGVLAPTLNNILYKSIGIDDSVSKWDIKKVNEDEFILSYAYFNKIKQKEYLVGRSIDSEQYDIIIKGKSGFNIRYLNYFPESPHIERVDSKRSWLLYVGILILVGLGIRERFFSKKSAEANIG